MIDAQQLPDDVHRVLCNGMGPRGGILFKLLWGFLLLIRIGRYFRLASNNHDVRCFAGGTEEDRTAVDRAFLTEMLDVAMQFQGWKRRYARFFALRAFELVNEFEDDVGAWTYRSKPLTMSEVVALTRQSGPGAPGSSA